MTRGEAQPAWEKVVKTGISDYNSLNREQRVWFNIEPLTTGGIIDHYTNHGAEHNEDTINDLEMLGFADIAKLLRRINALFISGQPPTDIDKRNKQIVDWNNEHNALLDQIDEQFWDRNEALEDALSKHIAKIEIMAGR